MKNSDDPLPQIYINNEQNDIDSIPLDIDTFSKQLIQYLNLIVNYIEITLLTPESIQSLNHQYFKVDQPTDTITFNLTPDEPITGDIYLCPAVIQKNSRSFNSHFEEEFKLVIIHSFLHLTGETDDTPEAFQIMKAKQETILKDLQ